MIYICTRCCNPMATPRYACQHGALTLCVCTTVDPSVLLVRVRKRPADPFCQALAIPRAQCCCSARGGRSQPAR